MLFGSKVIVVLCFFLCCFFPFQLDLDELVGEYRRTGKDLLGSCIKPPLAAPPTAAPAPTPKKARNGAAVGSGVAAAAGVKLEDGDGVEVKAEAQEGPAVLAAGGQGTAGGAAGKKHQAAAAPPGLQPQDSGVTAAAAAAADEGQHRTQGTFQLRPAAPLPAGSPFIVAVTPSAPAGGAKVEGTAKASCLVEHVVPLDWAQCLGSGMPALLCLCLTLCCLPQPAFAAPACCN